ncbi:MAG: histidine-type phosphatase [Bacteroidales bacterium]|nr:histidine-type phosphatase [Bacteroidales bacterium]
MKYYAVALFSTLLLVMSSCRAKAPKVVIEHKYPIELTEAQLLANPNLLGGIYAAYPGPQQDTLTPAPAGYEAFYVSNYNRHGSRYQPSDARYVNTLQRLQDGHKRGVLTEYGESLIPRIQLLCDSCLGHGGQLSSVGVEQLTFIGARLGRRFREVFAQTMPGDKERRKFVSARSSVVPRCGASMRAFCAGLESTYFDCFPALAPNSVAKTDSADMAYIAYDSPEMKALSSRDAPWQKDYDRFKVEHVNRDRFIKAIFKDATGVDTLNMAIDLYWLVVGMQDVDVPGCDLSDVFTLEELLQCYQCVNYRMYICNANCPLSNNIPAQSASTLLKNIIESADAAIATDTIAAHLRFGHDSNLLRLITAMHLHNAVNSESDPSKYWQAWQEYTLSPMAANVQLIFYRPALPSNPSNSSNLSNHSPSSSILVRILLNEHEILLDSDLQPAEGCFYRWSDLRSFWSKQIVDNGADGLGTVNIQ